MYGEMTHHVIKKTGNTDDSSQQDVYIQRGSDAEHPCADRRKVYSFGDYSEDIDLNVMLKADSEASSRYIGLHQRDTATQPWYALRSCVFFQTSLAKKGRANRVELWTLLMTSSSCQSSTDIVLCLLSNQIVAKKPHPPNQQHAADQHLIFVP